MKTAMSRVSTLVHRFFWLAGIIAVASAIIVAGSISVMARSDVDVFPGTEAPGAHDWWDINQAQAQFCSQCHNAIDTELQNTQTAGTHPLTACVNCHGTQGSQAHAALPAKCVDCHANRATELTNDAHASLLGQLGETETDASWTCKACHTKIDVDMTTTLRGALQLQQGGP